LSGTCWLLVGVDERAIRINTSVVVAFIELDMKGNADKTKYNIMSRDQTGRSHSMERDRNCSGKVEKLIYLGWNLTNKDSSKEEIKSNIKHPTHPAHAHPPPPPHTL
jgi:hypothetical protein